MSLILWLTISDVDETHVQMLRERYLCPHFCILVIGRANAGKTTILEKVCGVATGTQPIIYDKNGKSLSFVLPLTVEFLQVISLSSLIFIWCHHMRWVRWWCIVWMYWFTCNDNREASMILSIKLHTLEVTLFSMTPGVLNLVQLRNWRLLGSSLKRSLEKLS